MTTIMVSNAKLRPEVNWWWRPSKPTINPLNPKSSGLSVERRSGQMSRKTQVFANELYTAVRNHIQFNALPMSLKPEFIDKLVKIATISLARSRSGRLEWLVWQGIIKPEDISSINDKEVTPLLVKTFATSLRSILSDYASNNYTEAKIKKTIKRLLPRPAAEALAVVFDKEGVQAFLQEKNILDGLSPEQREKVERISLSCADSRHFSIHYSSNPKEGAKKALTNATKLIKFNVRAFIKRERFLDGLSHEQKKQFSNFSLSFPDAWRFATSNPKNPEKAAKKALRNAIELIKFNIQAFIKREKLLDGLSHEQKKQVSNFSLSFPDAWYFAVHNSSNPEKAAKKALTNATKLIKFNVWAFIKRERLLDGLSHEQKKQFSNFSLSFAEAWHFATSSLKNSEKAAKKALRNAIELIKFNIQAFFQEEKLLEGLSPKQREQVSKLFLSLRDVWRFAVYNPSNPEKAAKRAFKNALDLIENFDVQGFFQEEKLLDGLSPKQREQVSQLFLFLREAWQFAVYNPLNPEEAAKRAFRNLINLIKNFDALALLQEKKLLDRLSPKQRKQVSNISLSLTYVRRIAVRNIAHPEEAIKKDLRYIIKLIKASDERVSSKKPTLITNYLLNNANKP